MRIAKGRSRNSCRTHGTPTRSIVIGEPQSHKTDQMQRIDVFTLSHGKELRISKADFAIYCTRRSRALFNPPHRGRIGNAKRGADREDSDLLGSCEGKVSRTTEAQAPARVRGLALVAHREVGVPLHASELRLGLPCTCAICRSDGAELRAGIWPSISEREAPTTDVRLDLCGLVPPGLRP